MCSSRAKGLSKSVCRREKTWFARFVENRVEQIGMWEGEYLLSAVCRPKGWNNGSVGAGEELFCPVRRATLERIGMRDGEDSVRAVRGPKDGPYVVGRRTGLRGTANNAGTSGCVGGSRRGLRSLWSNAGTMGVWEGKDLVCTVRGAKGGKMGVWAGKACYARYGEQGCKKWVYGREKTWFAQFVEQRWSNGCVGGRR